MLFTRFATPDIRATSSGNLLADKRFAYGEACAAEGDFTAAADLFGQAAEAAPGWAAAPFARGSVLEQGGDVAGARAAFAAAVARDPADRLGASLRLDRLEGGASSSMPAAYVETLFDQYASRFDAHLLDGLGYRGPQVIMEALEGHEPSSGFATVLDLGCGTGLMGRTLARSAGSLDGIDLSGAMLKQAEATGAYRHLWQGDCAVVAGGLPSGTYALAVAADVLVYLGDLVPLFREVARVLEPGGVFAATAQTHDATGFDLGADLRFRHAPAYLRDTLGDAGLTILSMAGCVTRREGGTDVPGLVFVAHRA